MVERIQGWRCIGCGKVDAPRPCIGVCQDRPVELVQAGDYDALRARAEELEAFAKLIAHLTPRAVSFWPRQRLFVRCNKRPPKTCKSA